jgi:hypothetical protein
VVKPTWVGSGKLLCDKNAQMSTVAEQAVADELAKRGVHKVGLGFAADARPFRGGCTASSHLTSPSRSAKTAGRLCRNASMPSAASAAPVVTAASADEQVGAGDWLDRCQTKFISTCGG